MALCQTLSARHCVCQTMSAWCRPPDGHQPNAVCQTALCQTVWQTQCLVDDVRQTLSAWYRLADAACRTPRCQTLSATLCLPDNISQILSARRPSARLSGRRRLNWSEYEGKAWEQGYLLPDMHLPPSVVSTKGEVWVRVQTCRWSLGTRQYTWQTRPDAKLAKNAKALLLLSNFPKV